MAKERKTIEIAGFRLGAEAEVGCVKSHEVWKAIPKTRGWYQVSNRGRIRSRDREVVRKDGSIQTFQGRILKPGRSVYPNVALSIVGQTKTVEIHRLVALLFVANPESKKCINHLDGNKWNNKATNLEWVTYKENMQHASRLGLAKGGSMKGSSNPNSKLKEWEVKEILSDTRPGTLIARAYGVTQALVSQIKRKKAWRHVS